MWQYLGHAIIEDILLLGMCHNGGRTSLLTCHCWGQFFARIAVIPMNPLHDVSAEQPVSRELSPQLAPTYSPCILGGKGPRLRRSS
jgi:hypothetical protein